MSSGEPQYLVLGHSSEEPIAYEERPRIPAGYTLLLLTECDMATRTADVYKAIELAGQVPLDLTKFRIYKEGDLYPSLDLRLLSDFYISKTAKGKDITAISRSGVYPVPLDKSEFEFVGDYIERYWHFDEATRASIFQYHGKTVKIENSSLAYITYKKSLIVDEENYEKDFVDTQFMGSIYPNKKDLKEIVKSTKTVDELRERLSIPLKDLFEKLGPGLYIVPSCRSLSIDLGEAHDELFDYIEKEIEPELGGKLTLRRHFNSQKYRKQKLNYLNSLKNHPKLQEEPWKGKLETVRNRLRKIVGQIENVRSKSVGRQRGKNARKTRKLNRKYYGNH